MLQKRLARSGFGACAIVRIFHDCGKSVDMLSFDMLSICVSPRAAADSSGCGETSGLWWSGLGKLETTWEWLIQIYGHFGVEVAFPEGSLPEVLYRKGWFSQALCNFEGICSSDYVWGQTMCLNLEEGCAKFMNAPKPPFDDEVKALTLLFSSCEVTLLKSPMKITSPENSSMDFQKGFLAIRFGSGVVDDLFWSGGSSGFEIVWFKSVVCTGTLGLGSLSGCACSGSVKESARIFHDCGKSIDVLSFDVLSICISPRAAADSSGCGEIGGLWWLKFNGSCEKYENELCGYGDMEGMKTISGYGEMELRWVGWLILVTERIADFSEAKIVTQHRSRRHHSWVCRSEMRHSGELTTMGKGTHLSEQHVIWLE
ncbi:unnamed protein product [Ilex paraguariensis]|uniref:Uncharacterized protein n=1 Tax=Ilex paraguariensis TaxID=185542 RepID=A0ABC8SWW2_9AQUA